MKGIRIWRKFDPVPFCFLTSHSIQIEIKEDGYLVRTGQKEYTKVDKIEVK